MACDCECASGKFGCGCCCASVTGLRAGIHPDTIKSVHMDLLLKETGTINRTHYTQIVLDEPTHIVSVDINLATVRRDLDEADRDKQLIQPSSAGNSRIDLATPIMVSLFTIPGWDKGDKELGGWNASDDDENGRVYCCSGSVSASVPSWRSAPDLFGYFADGGLFAEINAPTEHFGVRVVVNYVERLQFHPAYHDPVAVMQHYWKCSRGEDEFLDGFYGGTSHGVEDNDTGSTPREIDPDNQFEDGDVRGTNPFSIITTDPTDETWFTDF